MSQFIFSRGVIERVAEDKIRAAIEEGKFDNLPGHGKPIADIDEPYDPTWWVKRWIDRERLYTAELNRMKRSS